VKSDEVLIRALAAGDLPPLDAFRCSTGTPWEDMVEAQIRGPLPQRYLAAPPRFDGRTDECPDPHADLLAQRWGELPQTV
jgi:hypothetical protein